VPASSTGTVSSATVWFAVIVTCRPAACVAATRTNDATIAAETARVPRTIAADLARYESRTPEETEALGGVLATRLTVGDVVTVRGELGSGKTTFVRGACQALGVEDAVTSPSFTIGHRYHGRAGDVSHLDLFRFRDVSAAEWGDLEPYFDDAIVFVEWPEAGLDALPAPTVDVAIEHAGGDARILVVRDADPGVRHGD
jgi:tRNA threonylcarbamoyladenosine biosynthesis protein TsaE